MTPLPAPVRALIARIADVYGVTVADVLGESRTLTIARARHAVIAELRTNFGFSLPEIGRIVGRDHTTVLAALRKCGVSGKPRPPVRVRVA